MYELQVLDSDHDTILHSTFIRKYRSGFHSLGFAKRNQKMMYMKPHSRENRMETTEDEIYCFEDPVVKYTDGDLLLLNIGWNLICEARVELDGI